MIRWKLVTPVISLSLVSLLFSLFFLDDIIRKEIIRRGESLAEAKVSIEKSALRFSPFGIRLTHIKVADKHHPFQNLVEAGHATIALNSSALLKKKLIIEDLKIENLAFHTPRKTSGKLNKTKTALQPSKSEKTEPSSREKSKPFSFPLLESSTAKNLVDTSKLSSSKQANTLEKTIQAMQEALQDNPPSKLLNAKIQVLKEQLDALPKNIPSASEISPLLAQVKQIQVEIQEIKHSIESEKEKLLRRKSTVDKQIQAIKKASTEDYKKLIQTLNLDTYKRENVSQTLFSAPIEKRIAYFRTGYLAIKKWTEIQRSKTKPHSKSATEIGTTVQLQAPQKLPRFWVKRAVFSGQADTMSVSGKLTNLTSNQKGINQTTQLHYQQSHHNGEKISMTLNIDSRSEPLIVELQGTADNTSYSKQKHALPSPLQSLVLHSSLNIRVAANVLEGHIHSEASHLHFDDTLLSNRFIQGLLNSIKGFDLDINLTGPVDHPKLQVSSSLDDQLNALFRKQIQDRKTALQRAIQDQIEDNTNKQLRSIKTQFTTYSELLNADLKKEEQIKNIEAQLKEKKELTKTGQEQLKKEIESKADDLKKQFQSLF